MNVASSLFFESAVEIFRRVCREIRPRAAMPAIEVEYKRFANANSHVRLESGAIRVRITDLLENAPAPVTEALAHILLGKLYRKPVARQYVHRYRLYLNRQGHSRADQAGAAGARTKGRTPDPGARCTIWRISSKS